MSSDLVLVSGTTGFLGTAVTLAYLKKGYRVRGTARSSEKAQKWEKKHADQFEQGKLEWAIVKDIAAEGAFDEAIKGVTILAHTASPFHYDVKDNEKDMLIPARDGTRHALRAAQKESSVKRVVVTSSFAAVLDFNRMSPDVTFSHEDWNPATWDEAKKSDNPTYVYCASKKLAEEEAWKIAKEPETKFRLSTICPPLITGPPQQVIESLDSLNTSSGAVWGVVDAEKIPDTSFPVGTDVRDIADLHVLASTTDEGADKRFLTIAFHFDNTQIAAIARKSFPELKDRVVEAPVSEGSPHFSTDASLAEKTFGFKWISFEQSVKDTLAEILKVEKELKH
ncbi:uncharacterized protein RHOBADRAFT_29212 [Rhodotorula graminis WP1]|uniref:3-beta hydroxysteroid dehydrogenase/isomerase domain-containing protein n=1 Tax=Rhodotorula graminis (strain WP1) TaxID=578459 RepID=A0A0P9F0M3_RHOGW|nr:uncharacterized protein RHOBADRAFT_29212 [Rhodotorula graminis WP1]KPV72993.1 hypothetical protein RHOBADRAFT_29212 [Rhodotorula graminis WP1]